MEDDNPILPKAKRRVRRVYPDGNDYKLYLVAGKQESMPEGTLLRMPDDMRFVNAAAVERWIANSGDKLAGCRYAIVRVCGFGEVHVENKPVVRMVKAKKHVLELESESVEE